MTKRFISRCEKHIRRRFERKLFHNSLNHWWSLSPNNGFVCSHHALVTD